MAHEVLPCDQREYFINTGPAEKYSVHTCSNWSRGFPRRNLIVFPSLRKLCHKPARNPALVVSSTGPIIHLPELPVFGPPTATSSCQRPRSSSSTLVLSRGGGGGVSVNTRQGLSMQHQEQTKSYGGRLWHRVRWLRTPIMEVESVHLILLGALGGTQTHDTHVSLRHHVQYLRGGLRRRAYSAGLRLHPYPEVCGVDVRTTLP